MKLKKIKGKTEAQGNYKEMMKKNPTILKLFSKFEDEEDIYSSTEEIKEDIGDDLTNSQLMLVEEMRLREQVPYF